jgi:hypothetical protein
MYTIEMASCGMIYIPSFVKIGTSIQAILRFCLRDLRGCNVGTTDGSAKISLNPVYKLSVCLYCDRNVRTVIDMLRFTALNATETMMSISFVSKH